MRNLYDFLKPLWVLALLVAGLGFFPGSEPRGAEQRYTVDGKNSRIVVHLYRGGIFFNLAHDHAIVAEGISGSVIFDPAHLQASSLRLRFPVERLLVDLPKERERLKLAGEFSVKDRHEIRANMLSPKVLDATRFPQVEMASTAVAGQLPGLTLKLKVRIRGVEKELPVKAMVTIAEGVLRAEGEFTFLQSAFGIEPFSALLGAIGIQDKIHVLFTILAR